MLRAEVHWQSSVSSTQMEIDLCRMVSLLNFSALPLLTPTTLNKIRWIKSNAQDDAPPPPPPENKATANVEWDGGVNVLCVAEG